MRRLHNSTVFVFGVIVAVFLFVLFIPMLAVSIRRPHDLDKSGWWYLIMFVPFLGSIALLVWLCFKGTDGENRFGTLEE